jgi:crossover junction endodeoxyribonuclease RusA
VNFEIMLRARVIGVPVTQGSMKGFVLGGRAKVVNSNDAKLRPWREAVRASVVEALPPDWQPIPGPVAVELAFALPKPSSAPRRRRTWPTGPRSGDIDKLTRCVHDACTDAGVWRDDSQVVDLRVTKDYPDSVTELHSPGVVIHIAAISTEGTHLL